MKKRTKYFAVSSAIIIIFGFYACLRFSNHRHALKEGFDHYQSMYVDGIDEKTYKVEIFWDNLHTIPGEHNILARTWISKNNFLDQLFSSGNRRQLESVKLQKQKGPDKIIFKFQQAVWERSYIAENTVGTEGIIGYPQLVSKKYKKKRIETSTD